MKQKTLSTTAYILRILSLFPVFLFAAFFTYSFIKNIGRAIDFVDIILSLLPLIAALGFWTVLALSIRSLATRLVTDTDGIGIARFGVRRFFIRWEDVAEAGIGHTPSRISHPKRLYFATRSLTEDEKKDLDLAPRVLVYCSGLSGSWIAHFQRCCPAPLPPEYAVDSAAEEN